MLSTKSSGRKDLNRKTIFALILCTNKSGIFSKKEADVFLKIKLRFCPCGGKSFNQTRNLDVLTINSKDPASLFCHQYCIVHIIKNIIKCRINFIAMKRTIVHTKM